MKSEILFFGMLLTFMLTANLAAAQSCNPAACSKVAEKSTCAKTTTTSTASVVVDEIMKTVTNVSSNPTCTKPCDPAKCTEEEKKKCASVCPPGCCAGSQSEAKTVKTAEVKTAQTAAKSSKL